MELIIKIDEAEYNKICNYDGMNITRMMSVIQNGTLLPKGHGRLLDANSLLACLEKDSREAFTKHQVWLMFSEYNEDVPTVIEADYGA